MPKSKLLIAAITLTILSLACSSLGPLLEEGGISLEPSDTPLTISSTNTWPPPPTELPTETPTDEPVVEPSPEAVEPAVPTEASNTLFVDDFSDPASGWDRFNNNDGMSNYEDGSYKIGVYQKSILLWGNPSQNFEDVAIEVIATKVKGGDDMQYGIICRHLDVDNFYALVVSADGYAAIRKRIQGGEIDYIAEWKDSPVINQGNSTNLLRVECVGERLAIYANGVLLLEAFDSELPNGDVGLLAGTFSAEEVEVLFDNFVVSAP